MSTFLRMLPACSYHGIMCASPVIISGLSPCLFLASYIHWPLLRIPHSEFCWYSCIITNLTLDLFLILPLLSGNAAASFTAKFVDVGSIADNSIFGIFVFASLDQKQHSWMGCYIHCLKSVFPINLFIILCSRRVWCSHRRQDCRCFCSSFSSVGASGIVNPGSNFIIGVISGWNIQISFILQRRKR